MPPRLNRKRPAIFTVDHASGTTLYEQLITQFRAQLDDGTLIAGAKLPTVRQLATDLAVAPYTVARVYRALEADGFVETLGRNGTVVKGTAGTSKELLQLAASAYAARARELGVDPADALDYVKRALDN
ncbi:GntR family transcriptional regulator [soil metagenome]